LNQTIDLKYLLTILNSKLINFYFKLLFPLKQGGYYSMSSTFIDKIPISLCNDQQPFIAKADTMLSKNQELKQLAQSLLQFLQAKHGEFIINKKLTNWPTLSYKDFLNELIKQKIKLSLQEQNEWLNYFEAEKQKAMQIKNLIDITDKEIDQMVYALYGLSEEEVKIVENQ
jgi:hypothetical protein